MEMYSDLNYNESGYVDGDGVVNSDCDYIQSLNDSLNVLNQKLQSIDLRLNQLADLESLSSISQKIADIDAQIVNGIDVSTLDLSPITSTIETSLTPLVTSVENIVTTAVTDNVSGLVANASLNGYGAEYKDGDTVTVSGRDIIYTVNRSFFSMYADNAYTVHYDLTSLNGQKMIVPEALLTRYVPAAP